MSGVNGKGQRSIKKKSVEESLIPSVTFKTVRFMHEAAEGETVIDTGALVAPTEAVNNGFAQPSSSELGALNLLQYKNKVVIRSTSRPAMLQFLDYKVTGAATINLIVPALDGEVFEVIVSDDSRSGTTAVDATPLVRSFVLPAGTNDVSVGSYPVGKFPSEQLGALLVFEGGQLLNRTVGNQPDGEGDYYELANVIRLVNTDTEDRNIVVVSHSSIIEEPEGSLLSMIESLAGQVDGIIPTLAALAGVPETDFQAQPNNADTKAFGDRVFANEQRSIANEAEATASSLGKTFKNKTQTKFLTADVTTNSFDMADLQFNNLVVGKRYKVSGLLYFARLTPSGDNVDITLFSGAGGTGTVYGQNTAYGDQNGTVFRISPNLEFTAVSDTLYFRTESLGGNSEIRGDGTTRETHIHLTELNDTEITTDFT